MTDREPVVQGKETNGRNYEVLNTLSEQDRLKVLFVKAGFAKAGNIVFEHFEITQSWAEEAKKCATELESLGLFANDNQLGPGTYQTDYADTPETLKKVATSEITDQDRGRIYGYPETAVQSFPNGLFQTDKIPPEITTNPLFSALPFVFSPENYRDEWDQYVAKARKVKELFPELVSELHLEDLYY